MNSNFDQLLFKDLKRISDDPKIVETNKIKFLLHILKVALFNGSFRVVFFYRVNHKLNNKGSRFLLKIFLLLYIILTPIQIPYTAKIDGGLFLPHPLCIVIHDFSIIGENATILQGVTLGGNVGKKRMINNSVRSSPILGDNVLVGAGAKILGPVIIGNNSMIGANAVVTKDVPENSVAVGIPAEIIGKVEKNYLDIEKGLKKNMLEI